MHYDLQHTAHLSANTTLVVGYLENQPLDTTIPFVLENSAELATFTTTLTKLGDIAWQTNLSQHSVLIIHCGDEKTYTDKKLTQIIDNITAQLIKAKSKKALICLPQIATKTPDWQLQYMQLRVDYGCYQHLTYKTQDIVTNSLTHVDFYLANACQSQIKITNAIAAGIKLTRDLANAPANVCTPTYLAEKACEIAQNYPTLTAKHFDRTTLEKMGMNTLLAVARGSHESPQFIEMHYKGGAQDTAPIILVGKGITFDSGGISLKPAAHMGEMKYDMSGAASVLGTLKACALLELPINVIGLMACAENMPGGSALKPGDVIKSYAGLTVEISNTDAEGRLVLADALHYAKQFKPKFVIDIATLTGAVIVALGTVHSGIMTTDEELATLIQQASDVSQDTTWRLPLEEAYNSDLESPIADIVNSTETREAGTVTAACFLSRFIEGYRWAHLDIAGTAWVGGKKCDATGRPVGLLVEILRQATNAS